MDPPCINSERRLTSKILWISPEVITPTERQLDFPPVRLTGFRETPQQQASELNNVNGEDGIVADEQSVDVNGQIIEDDADGPEIETIEPDWDELDAMVAAGEIVAETSTEPQSGSTPVEAEDGTSGDDEEYGCMVCSAVFTNLTALLEHERSNHLESGTSEDSQSPPPTPQQQQTASFGLYRCPYPTCTHYFADLNSPQFKAHHSTHTGKRPSLCAICQKVFDTPAELQEHCRQVHVKKTIHRCPQCKTHFSTEESLKHHRRTSAACLGRRVSQARTNLVEQGYDPERQCYVCSTCMRTFRQAKNLRRHEALHNESPADAEELEEHLAASSTSTTTTSKHNDEIFTKPIIATAADDRPAVCGICTTICCDKFTYDYHKRIHSPGPVVRGTWPYTNLIPLEAPPVRVGKASEKQSAKKQTSQPVVDRSTLKQQSLTTQCPRCFKKFTNAFSLRRHQRLAHTVERPYHCDKCDQRFKLLQHLKKHQASVHAPSSTETVG